MTVAPECGTGQATREHQAPWGEHEYCGLLFTWEKVEAETRMAQGEID